MLGFVASAQTQEESIDEIYNLTDANRYLFVWDSLSNSGGGIFGTRIQDWLEPTERCYQLAELAGDSAVLFEMKYPMGVVYHTLAQFEECIPLFQDILKQEDRLSDDRRFISYLKLEEAFRRTGNLKEAIPIRKRRIELGHASNFWEIYADAQLYDEAVKDYRSSVTIPEQGWNRMMVYVELANLFFQDESLDSADHFYQLAYQDGVFISERNEYDGVGIYSESNKHYWTAYCQGMIGRIMVKRKQYREAIPKLKVDIATSKTIGEVDNTLPKRLDLATCYIALQDFPTARAYLDTVQNLMTGRGWVDTKLQALEVESDYYFNTNQLNKSAIYLRDYKLLNDSIIRIRARNNLIAMTTLLDSDKQRATLAELRTDQIQRRNQRNLLIAGLVILVIVLVAFYFRYRQKMKAKAQAERDRAIIAEQAEELKELNKAKTRFFSNISHEFRTPLTLIQGPLESVIEGRTGEKETKDNLKVAHRNIGTLRRLIDEILDFNKLEQGELQLTTSPVFLKSFIEDRQEGFELLASEKGISFHTSHSFEDGLSVETVPDKLENILNNLVSNAIKHSPEHSTVSFSMDIESSQLKGRVTDEGPGIAKEDLDKIFERFYQSSHGKLVPHSSGIGLAYVKEIINVMGGTIYVESELKKGTTFYFEIPVVTLQSSQEPKDEDQSPIELESYKHDNNKVLIVEDNIEMAEYLEQTLGDEFEISKAGNGYEALEILENKDVDLIITDLMMPKMDGIELISRLKSDDAMRRKSIIVLSAKTGHETKLEALSFGLDDYITKPFSPTELEARVKNLLNNQYERSQWLLENGHPQEVIQATDPLITKVLEFIIENISSSQLGVAQLADETALSERQLTRLMKQFSGLTPALFIREVKLKFAKERLESKQFRSVAQAAYAVGFEKPSHFSSLFVNRFGKKPSEYLK